MATKKKRYEKVKQTVTVGIGPGQRFHELVLTADVWQYPDQAITNRQMRNALRPKLLEALNRAYPD